MSERTLLRVSLRLHVASAYSGEPVSPAVVNESAWTQDHYDVKMPCHLLLGKLAGAAPDQVRQALPRLVDPLQRTLHAKVKQDAVKQEVLRSPSCRCQLLQTCTPGWVADGGRSFVSRRASDSLT